MNTVITRFNRLRSVTRLLLCLGIAGVVLTVSLSAGLQLLTSIVLTWACFSFGMILTSWITFLTVSDIDLYMEVKQEDTSSPVIFLIIVSSVCCSLAGILALMNNTDQSLILKGLHQFLSLLGIAFSWALLHTIFTLHYARLYYADDPTATEARAGGLDFPGDEKPDYLDFAYFSFVIGMTFQVSDVVIRSRPLRKLVLLHSLISFIFNTLIVALTISVLSGSGK